MRNQLATTERREFERAYFPPKHGGGIQFRLQINGQRAAVGDIVDLSRRGLGLRVIDPVDEGAIARVTMQVGHSVLTVSGVVRWCEPVTSPQRRNDPGVYHLGIAFDPADTRNNILFFVTLSRFCASGD